MSRSLEALDRGSRPSEAGCVGALVHDARRDLVLARAGETLLAGVTAALLGLAAAATSRADGASASTWFCAGLCGVLGAAAHWAQHTASPRAVATALDRGLGLEGALATAWELERRGGSTLMGRLLSQRVCRGVDRRAARNAVLPRLGPRLALPLFAGALLALARDAEHSPRDEDALTRLARRARVDLAGLSEWAGTTPELEPGERHALAAVAARASAIEADLAADVPRSAELASELSDLQEEVARLRAEMPSQLEIARRLERIQGELDFALGASKSPSPSATVRDLEDARVGAGGTEEDAGALVPGGSDGTMSRLDLPAPPAGAPRAEAGLAGGRWWAAEDSALVARWVELRRDESAGANR